MSNSVRIEHCGSIHQDTFQTSPYSGGLKFNGLVKIRRMQPLPQKIDLNNDDIPVNVMRKQTLYTAQWLFTSRFLSRLDT